MSDPIDINLKKPFRVIEGNTISEQKISGFEKLGGIPREITDFRHPP